ncbi:hypothetical protein PILCRDRAFT_92307 [Piloderma croceum F 1598]|uniref:Uncharacterized protein n=1 Tax=Piloderma croceum (strain F 1598) TaxID=765440 RepID=A0A0C3F4K4_PILCF|nr:hypothetical protein PILCRDRAFT_92307 [Piloderma croceum F 1598]
MEGWWWWWSLMLLLLLLWSSSFVVVAVGCGGVGLVGKCLVGVGSRKSRGSEAGPLKKRKVVVEKVEKGKGKEKEVDVWGEILVELQGLRVDMWEFHGEFQNAAWVGNHIAKDMKVVAGDVCNMADYLVPQNGVQGEVEEEALEGTLV